MKLVNKNTKANLILSIFVFCAMMVFLYSCGSGGSGDGSSETGSVSFGLALQDSGSSRTLTNQQLDDDIPPFECETDEYLIASIEAQVVDEIDELLAEGGPFDCDDRQGEIGDVEAGDNRIVKVFAKDESGEIIAEGESDPVAVVAGLTVNAGTIILKLVNSAPVADAGPDQTPFVGDTVTLDGSGSSDIDGDLLSFSWSITSRPSGSQAVLSDPTAVNPTFEVDEFGEYVAQLIVNDGTVDSEPDTVIINTDNSAPVADAGPDQTRFVGETVTLDGNGSSDVDGNVLSYSWSITSLPPDSQAILSDPTAVNPTFDLDVFGTYVVQLIVNDGTVNSEPDEVIIDTQSVPVADAGPDQTVFLDEVVILDGSGSNDVDGDPLSYFWSFTNLPSNSTATLSDPTAVDPNFTVDVRETYVVQLIVNDGTADSTPDTVRITVQNRVPVANAGPDQTVTLPIPNPDVTNPPISVTLDGSASEDPDPDQLNYFWTLTRVPSGSQAQLSDATAVNPTFDAEIVGIYEVQLIVNDGAINSLPDTVSITVNPPVL